MKLLLIILATVGPRLHLNVLKRKKILNNLLCKCQITNCLIQDFKKGNEHTPHKDG